MKQWLSMIAVCTLLSLPGEAQELGRRSFLGIQMETITDDVKRLMEINEDHGVLINNVVPGSTAEAAGFRRGDILLKIDGQKMKSPDEAVAYVGGRKSNESFSYELVREKKRITGKSTFRSYPTESYKDLDVSYTQSKTSMGLQRVIITRNRQSGRQPVIAFVGGVGCYSLDMPLDTGRSEIQLINTLARAGYTVARLEKPGMGDGAGTSKACNEVGFHEEADGYVQMINDLKARKDINANEVYILGHSMGGVMAPVIAAKTPVKGVIAYGTIGSNFIEYLAKTRRTIGEAYEWAPDETDAFVKDFCECAVYYFADKMTPAQAAAKKADCGGYLSVFELRSRKYNDELYALNIPGAWKSFSGRALFAWGEADFIASREDHELIADAVNHYHAGTAVFKTVKQSDHGMNRAASFKDAKTNPGRYNPEFGSLVLAWLREQS